MSWIDFKALREQLQFAQILKYYKVEHRVKGERASCFCPLPNHRGTRRSPSFSADLRRGLFQCFGCSAKGNLLEFACLMENLDPQSSRDFYKVASKLKEQLVGSNGRGNLSGARPPAKAQHRLTPEKRNGQPQDQRPASAPKKHLPVIVNLPLDFELKNLDPEHPYLLGRGFTGETIEHFGLGFCSKGSLKDRIAIPLEDQAGKLVGYAGRVIDDQLIGEDNPKYLFPGEREREGRILRFMKSTFLYNGFRIERPVRDLVVVEGFPSVWWLWQNSVSNTVALMGSSCSKEQGKLIVDLVDRNGCVWVFTDGDDAGRRCAGSVFLQVAPYRFTRLVACDEGKQPTDWTPEELLGSFAAMNEESDSSEESLGATDQGNTEEAQVPAAAT